MLGEAAEHFSQCAADKNEKSDCLPAAFLISFDGCFLFCCFQKCLRGKLHRHILLFISLSQRVHVMTSLRGVPCKQTAQTVEGEKMFTAGRGKKKSKNTAEVAKSFILQNFQQHLPGTEQE